MTSPTLSTSATPTWCPGCFNFQILAGVKRTLIEYTKKNGTAIVTGIGCAAKIFDYINLPGINTLHGRVPPTCLGMKVADPKLTVIGFSGDGDAYAEGMEHTIHAARLNSNFKYIVHNNQTFALTVGQPTPTSEVGFKDKTTPRGVKTVPINPIKLMLSANCGFVARVFADVNQVDAVLKEALNHKGFAFIEIIQPCIIFHPDIDYKKHTYNLQEKNHDKSKLQEAMKRAEEFDYNKITDQTKIPIGIFYQDKTSKDRVYEEIIRK